MRKKLYICTGVVFVVLGFLGVFLPLLPTTPFLLVALFCFSRSSDQAKQWLTGNKLLGPYVRAYADSQGMGRRVKIRTLVLLWVVCIGSAVFATELLWVRLVLLVVVVGVTVHIVMMKGVANPKKTVKDSQINTTKGSQNNINN